MYYGTKMYRSLWYMLGVLLCATHSAQSFGQSRPNVVFVMVDDMGWNDVSFHGSDQIQTPNIDTLAYDGVILQQYYSEAICTPARSALLTGKYPMRLGMQGFPLYNSEDRGIPLTERLLPSYLKDLGYTTHLVGKWHVGMSREEFLPTSRGYDTHYGTRGGFVDYYTYNKAETIPDGRTWSGMDLFDNDIPQDEEERYLVDALTDRAVKLIRNHNTSRPLFLHMAHNAPHAGNGGGLLQPPLYSTVNNRHIADANRRLYAEMVTHLDYSIGRLVRALAEKDMIDDTIIAFMSDNGAPTVGQFSNWGVNLPFRGKKETPWEGGVRVPAFIWHAALKPRVWQGIMHITDWLPTLIGAAGGQLNKEIDGVNQWNSIVKGDLSNRKEVLIAVEDGGVNTYAAYRAGDYKVVVGNVTGIMNGYYGAEFVVNKIPPPPYYASLRSCDASRVLEELGKYLIYDKVQSARSATAVTQLDTVRDPTPCVPTPTQGCLFNVRKDPAERHNLWQKANKIALLLTSRLRLLWSQQMRRTPLVISPDADPANFGYRWMPWIKNTDLNLESDSKIKDLSVDTQNTLSKRYTDIQRTNDVTQANAVNCDSQASLTNFYCILRYFS